MEALIDVLDRDGSVRHSHAVHHWPVVLGRDLSCDVPLDDPHLAGRHIMLTATPNAAEADTHSGEATVSMEVLDCINGVQLGLGHWAAGSVVQLSHAQEWRMGHTRLRLRLAQAPLAPEVALPRPAAAMPGWQTTVLLVLLALWQATRVYLSSAQDAFWGAYVSDVGAMSLAVLLWSGLWALAGKLFQHRMMFWRHVGYTVSAILTSQVLEFTLMTLAYMTSWELLGRLAVLSDALILGAMLRAQFRLIQPTRVKTGYFLATAVVALMLMVQVGTRLVRDEPWTAELYMSALMPPQLHWSGDTAVADFVESARSLEAQLQRKAREPVKGVQDFVQDDLD